MQRVQGDAGIHDFDVENVLVIKTNELRAKDIVLIKYLVSVCPAPTEQAGEVGGLLEVELVEAPGLAQGPHHHVAVLARLEEVVVDVLRGRVQLLLLGRVQQPLDLLVTRADVVLHLPPPLRAPL